MKRLSIITLRRILKKKPIPNMKFPKFLICDCGELMKLNKSKDYFHCICGMQFWLPKTHEVTDDLERLEVIAK